MAGKTLTTYDGWTYTWNGENRMIMASNTTAGTVVECKYDYMGRRFSKTVDGAEATFIYDGWNMIQESSSSETNHYVWGLDLSQTLQGAGGIGGLLTRSSSSTNAVAYYCFDGNGNVGQLVDISDGTVLAKYTYGPFGNIETSEGTLDSDNLYRFSTKYTDSETDLIYYGYRYLNAELGRWMSRDPIGERGGLNLYVFARNKPVIVWDILGQELGFSPSQDDSNHGVTVAYQGQSGKIYATIVGSSLCDCQNDGSLTIYIYSFGDDSITDEHLRHGRSRIGSGTSQFQRWPSGDDEDDEATEALVYSSHTFSASRCPEGGQSGEKIVEILYGGQVMNTFGEHPARIKIKWKYKCKRVGDENCPCNNGYSCETDESLTYTVGHYRPSSDE